MRQRLAKPVVPVDLNVTTAKKRTKALLGPQGQGPISRSQRGRKVSGVSIWTNPDVRVVYVDGIAVDDDRSGHRRRRQHFMEKPANHAEL